LAPAESARGDEELAAAAAAGDREALEELLGRHAPRVHRICRRIVADPGDALDATQEALLAVARRIDHFDGRCAFTTWLYRVATNAALDELRRRVRRAAPTAPETIHARSDDDPSRVVDHLDIRGALSALPEEFRVAVVLRDLGDLPYAEIAGILGVPVGTVRSRIARGRALLAQRLEPGNRPGLVARPTEHP